MVVDGSQNSSQIKLLLNEWVYISKVKDINPVGNATFLSIYFYLKKLTFSQYNRK